MSGSGKGSTLTADSGESSPGGFPPIETTNNCSTCFPIAGIILNQKLCALEVGLSSSLEPKSIILKKLHSQFDFESVPGNIPESGRYGTLLNAILFSGKKV